jgi:hypothetical protein
MYFFNGLMIRAAKAKKALPINWTLSFCEEAKT